VPALGLNVPRQYLEWRKVIVRVDGWDGIELRFQPLVGGGLFRVHTLRHGRAAQQQPQERSHGTRMNSHAHGASWWLLGQVQDLSPFVSSNRDRSFRSRPYPFAVLFFHDEFTEPSTKTGARYPANDLNLRVPPPPDYSCVMDNAPLAGHFVDHEAVLVCGGFGRLSSRNVSRVHPRDDGIGWADVTAVRILK